MTPSRAAGSALAFLLVAASVVALQGAASAQTATTAATSPKNVTLRLTYKDPDGHFSSARLTCRGLARTATGYLRHRPVAACRTARRLPAFLASRPSPDRICDQQYGGPETARIRGTIGGRAIDKRFARRDGCGIYDWDRAGVLLPASRFAP